MTFKDILTVTGVNRACNDSVTSTDPDVHRFNTFGTGPVRINVGLTKITSGDADVRLFLDNGDGKLDHREVVSLSERRERFMARVG